MHDQFERLTPAGWHRSQIGPTHAADEYAESRKWCVAQFGVVRRHFYQGEIWLTTDSQWHYCGNGMFWFRTQTQAFDFMLRWG